MGIFIKESEGIDSLTGTLQFSDLIETDPFVPDFTGNPDLPGLNEFNKTVSITDSRITSNSIIVFSALQIVDAEGNPLNDNTDGALFYSPSLCVSSISSGHLKVRASVLNIQHVSSGAVQYIVFKMRFKYAVLQP